MCRQWDHLMKSELESRLMFPNAREERSGECYLSPDSEKSPGQLLNLDFKLELMKAKFLMLVASSLWYFIMASSRNQKSSLLKLVWATQLLWSKLDCRTCLIMDSRRNLQTAQSQGVFHLQIFLLVYSHDVAFIGMSAILKCRKTFVSANPLQGLTFYYHFLMHDATVTLVIAGFRSQIPEWFLMAESYGSVYRFGQKWHKLNFSFWQSRLTCWSGGKCNCFFVIEYLGHLSQAYAIPLLLLIAFTVTTLGLGVEAVDAVLSGSEWPFVRVSQSLLRPRYA